MSVIYRKCQSSIFLVMIILMLLTVTTSCSGDFLTQQSSSNHPISVATADVSVLPEGQGLFESCSPLENAHCSDRLKQMATAGFKLVVNYQQLEAHSSQVLDYADQAQSLGMKVIWAINNPAFWNGSNVGSIYKVLATTCGCSDTGGFTTYFVNLVKSLPATWRYYVGDDVSSPNHGKIKAFADSIKQLDPYHPRLIIAHENAKSPGSNIKSFVDATEVIGSTIYPVGSSEPMSTVGKLAHSLQATADQSDRQTMLVLQSFSAAQYGACSPPPGCARFPTTDEMRQMLAFALSQSHPRFILWYSYFDIFRSDNPSVYWTNLLQASNVSSTNLAPQ